MNPHARPFDMTTAPRVLLVIDQPVLAQYVTLALNHGISQTQVASTTEEALTAISSWRPHLVIIDMDLMRGSVLEQLGYTAPSTERLPIIALTRRGDLQTKLLAFDHGVDDILTVPFSPEELVARMLAVMRRTYHEIVTFTPVLRLGDLEIDILNRLVRIHGKELHLTAVEQSLLYLLAANAGQLLTRDEILDQLWGADYVAESNVVDRHIRNLRIKLQNGWKHPRYIATIPGQGYRFVATTTDEPPLV
jgi:two-component system, OmpR family, KDP operon response regulator KdpE